MLVDGQKTLFLGEATSPVYAYLCKMDEQVVQTVEEIVAQFIQRNNIGFLVSYGYRHIIKKSVLDLLPEAAINLHISLLPWNRGADPNLWSFFEDTPKVVSIHYIDVGLDTGDIIIQREIEFNLDKETLASSYALLHENIQSLFEQHWSAIKVKTCPRRPQSGTGSVHRVKDKKQLMDALPLGWGTVLRDVQRLSKGL